MKDETIIINETLDDLFDDNGNPIIEVDPIILMEFKERLNPRKEFSYQNGDHLTESIKNEVSMRESNILKFEGAGWDKADSNGVGNCRIRTTFKNDNGVVIYFEVTGHGNDNPKWHISHLFKAVDKKTNYTKEYSHLTRIQKEYTKENLLEFINTELDCSFTEIDIINNSSYSGFSCN